VKGKTGAILALMMIVATSLCTACGQSFEASPLGINAREASLTEIWERVLQVTGCDNSTANLKSMNLQLDSDGSIVFLYVDFQAEDPRGSFRVYNFQSGIKGKVTYYSASGGNASETAHPSDFFRELDQAISKQIVAQGISAYIDASFWPLEDISGSDYEYIDHPSNDVYGQMYLLKDGDLYQLSRVVFDTRAWGIYVWKNSDGPSGPRGTCELWFPSSVLDKAVSVEHT
jgi:hypothetical protein